VNLTTAILLGSVSMHTTTDYQPAGGYNRNHQTIGIEVLQDVDKGFQPGVMAFRFKDSFSKESRAAMVSYGYKHGWFKVGVAAGYTKTSYHDGFVAMPFIEAMGDRFGLQLGYIPKVAGTDSVVMLQGKIRF